MKNVLKVQIGKLTENKSGILLPAWKEAQKVNFLETTKESLDPQRFTFLSTVFELHKVKEFYILILWRGLLLCY